MAALFQRREGPWIFVSVPARELDSNRSQWYYEKSQPWICVTGRCDQDTYEIAVDPRYFLRLQAKQLAMETGYNPTQATENEKAVYGIREATPKKHGPWLQRAVAWIRRGGRAEIEAAYRHRARKDDLEEQLSRAILDDDIAVSLSSLIRP